ncbi:MAG TPA: hypothetical protein VIY08_05030 [Candidatus Nitrosocosmicus sp.]
MPRKIHVNTASPEERGIQKKTEQIFVDIQQQQQQQQQDGFAIVSLDESFFFYESCKARLD